jgi:hypothetical protein
MRALLAVLLLTLPSAAVAQRGPLTRTVEHEKLDFLVGEWQTTVVPLQAGQPELKGTMRFAWGVGGVWLEERVRLEFPGAGVRESLELITYDPRLKQYVGTWQDNLSARSTPFVAEWLDDGTFVMTATLKGGDGRTVTTTVRYTKVSDAEVNMEQFVTNQVGTPQLVFKQNLRKAAGRGEE